MMKIQENISHKLNHEEDLLEDCAYGIWWNSSTDPFVLMIVQLS